MQSVSINSTNYSYSVGSSSIDYVLYLYANQEILLRKDKLLVRHYVH